MDLAEREMAVVDWFGMDQDREKWGDLVNAIMNLLVL
jgi:uncharacterized membrane protein